MCDTIFTLWLRTSTFLFRHYGVQMYKIAMNTSIANHMNSIKCIGNTIVRWGDCCWFDRNQLRRVLSVQPNRLQFSDAAVDHLKDSKDDVLSHNSDDVSSQHDTIIPQWWQHNCCYDRSHQSITKPTSTKVPPRTTQITIRQHVHCTLLLLPK